MSNLELLHTGFSAIFGEGGLPSSDIHELSETTYTKMQPLEMPLQHGLPWSQIHEPFEESYTGMQPFPSLGASRGSIDPRGLDPQYDFYFSDVKDDGKKYMRGGHQYHRPYGWKKIAIKVRAVSYHGTQVSKARKIVKEDLKPGPRAKFGPGVYSSPSLEMVEKMYSRPFQFEGKNFKIAFQNRVNSRRVQIIPATQTEVGADYWLTQKDDIRPYGVLIKEIKEVEEFKEESCTLF
ncbi:uncharacterized protein LOC111327991 [Stylophora pistillata]|uniref:uncharacterized protein LOC111327991 n=1 Tax=Stylophora pistillata TaxID=50429 RepID=UPI000C055BFC|nr:uncharacterized protein LOC111327991 [Stylophora pistillata]